MKGYKEYLEVRKQKIRTMRISGAYAWVKGNHIDDCIANECDSEGVTWNIAKAGLAWQYLQFTHGDEEILFIVKNGRYFSKNHVSRGRDATGTIRPRKMSYMENLMKINKDIKFNEVEFTSEEITQLELIEDFPLTEHDNNVISKLEEDFSRFYIVTYNIDENHLISDISLFLPNPNNNKAYHVENLSNYITEAPGIIIDEDVKDALSNIQEVDIEHSAHEFDIVAQSEKKTQSN